MALRRKKKKKGSLTATSFNSYKKYTKRVPIDSLNLWANNPNNDYSTVPRLAELLKIHGQVSEVVVWPENNIIYKGNHTWKALKKLGAEEIDVLFVEFPNEGAAIAYAMADNQSGRWNDTMDPELLARLLKSKEMFKFTGGEEESRLASGFTEKEFKTLMLSTDEMPSALPNVEVTGFVAGKDDFMVIQFDSKEEMVRFRRLLGVEKERKRAVPFADLMKFMCSVHCGDREVMHLDSLKEKKIKKIKKKKKKKKNGRR